jgi:hypothetical protein
MLTAEADIRTEHAAMYLARLCGAWNAPGPRGPSVWTGASGPCRPSPDWLAVGVGAADQESLRRIQDLLTSRLQKSGRREHLTMAWRDLGG